MLNKTGFLLGIIIFSIFLFHSCSKENITEPENETDFFPISSKIVRTYSSNIFSDDENNFMDFEMKIDSAEFPNGKFLAFMGKFPEDTVWNRMLGLKDSGNVVYLLGDNPPEVEIPIFKHKYDDNEIIKDKIDVLGKQYDAIKIILTPENNIELKLWLVDGIGLVKEESEQGASIFFDEHWGKDFHHILEIVDVKELK